MAKEIHVTVPWGSSASLLGAGSLRIKKSLTELAECGREALTEQQQAAALDADRIRPQNGQNEDQLLGTAFKSLESQIASLRLDIEYWQPSSLERETLLEGRPVVRSQRGLLTPGTRDEVTDAQTLWDALQCQYDGLLRSMVNETVEDAMRLTASEFWEQDMADWDAYVSEFEHSLDKNFLWGQHEAGTGSAPHELHVANHQGIGDSLGSKATRGAVGSAAISQRRVTGVPRLCASGRLVLNLMGQPPRMAQRGPDGVAELVRLSCNSEVLEAAGLQEACGELWEVVVALCGLTLKNCGPEGSEKRTATCGKQLRCVVENSVRCLEELCKHQILHQLRVPTHEVSEEELFDKLKVFCSLNEGIDFGADLDQCWQLAYWSFRCGSSKSLHLTAQLVDSALRQGFFGGLEEERRHEQQDMRRQEAGLLVAFAELLAERLLVASRSPRANADDIFFSGTLAEQSCRVAKTTRASLNDVCEDLNVVESAQALNPVVALLASLLKVSNRSCLRLKSVMPSATAEDFLWYNLSYLLTRPLTQLEEGVSRLQRRIIESGPEHFGSCGSPPENLAFAKITALALAPTAAIDWLSQAVPETSIICLQLLVYLNQCGYAGDGQSLTAVLFPSLADFLGSTNLSSAFSDVLCPEGRLFLPCAEALQLCELLPRSRRASVASLVVNAAKRRLLEDTEQRHMILGSVADDGSCRGGVLYRVLLANDWSEGEEIDNRQLAGSLVPPQDPAQVFKEIVETMVAAAEEESLLFEQMELCYIISEDKIAMQVLLRLFAQPHVFPHELGQVSAGMVARNSEVPTLDENLEAQQNQAWKFFDIFKSRMAYGELQELEAQFEMLRRSSEAARVYSLMAKGLVYDAWRTLIEPMGPGHLSLFPDARLVSQWKDSSLAVHLPRLVDVSSLCLQRLQEAREAAARATSVEPDIAALLDTTDIKARATQLLNTVRELSRYKLIIGSAIVYRLRTLLEAAR